MKKILFVAGLLLFSNGLFSQTPQKISGSSPVKFVRAGKVQVTQSMKAIPDLIIKEEQFLDGNGNNIIDGDELCSLKFKIENLGQGEAKKVLVKVSLKNKDIQGLNFNPEIYVGSVASNAIKEVAVPLEGKLDLTDGIAEFKIEVLEDMGFDAYPLEMKIETHPFQPPDILVADAVFSTEGGGQIKLNFPINLKFLVQNTGKGDAKNVTVTCSFPNPNCILLGENDNFTIGDLKKGESRELDFLFTANRRYIASEIPVSIKITENYGEYAHDTVVRVGLAQNLLAQNNVVVVAVPSVESVIQKATLTSEVDRNIPENPAKNSVKFALIIGNEDYSKYQTGLTTEMNVIFARNDATVFREYVINTMGFPETNVYLLTDATTGEMNQKLDLISKLAIRTGKDAELLFYYAGHGLPDEATKIPYLIPVDVNSTNLNSAIKLSDIYKKLSETGARKITVILDACFSGGGRESGLLAARSILIKPSDEMLTGNMVAFSASSVGQSALPYRHEKHGLFTYFLLKKLQETKGDLTYGELANFLTKTISIESLKINQKEQDPSVNVSADVKDVWEKWNLR